MRFIRFIRSHKKDLLFIFLACVISFFLGVGIHIIAEKAYIRGYRDGWEAPHAVWDDETFQFVGPEVDIYQGEP